MIQKISNCILCIQRYENIDDIKEWINYHIQLGVSKIFIMDNNDEDSPLELDFDDIEIIPYYNQRNDKTDWIWQRKAYNFGFDYIRKKYPNQFQWISIIDIDEFITLRKESNISDFIQFEIIDKNLDNLDLKWELYNDNNIIFHQPEFDGNIIDTYKEPLPNINYQWNNPWKFNHMRLFTKFIGKFKDKLYYKESAHYPAKELYDKNIYQWNLCDSNIAVCRHYKYKSLEDFISKKCKLRNYITSTHGSTWKYTRTYFEDNDVSNNKVFAFAMFDFKYNLGMEQWDIEYLHELLLRMNGNRKNIFDIWFGENIHNEILDRCLQSRDFHCKRFQVYTLNEKNLDLNICDYTKFMYDHKLYGICADFYKCLFLYYFGGIYMDRDVFIYKDLLEYYNKNDYMFWDASFYNKGAWFTRDHMFCSSVMMSKPFNEVLKYFIEYCSKFTYQELEEMYNSKSKQEFMDYFYDVKIIYYHIIQKYGYKIKVLDNIDEITKNTNDNIIYVYNNDLLEAHKYRNNYKKQILDHMNIKSHEQVFMNT